MRLWLYGWTGLGCEKYSSYEAINIVWIRHIYAKMMKRLPRSLPTRIIIIMIGRGAMHREMNIR